MLRRETRKCPIQFVFAKTLFDGGLEPRFNILIEIENGRIKSLCGLNEKDVPLNALNAPIVAPGFIDIQINGAMDRQFTDDPTLEAIEAIATGARQGGTAHVLPTFTTAPGETYLTALRAVEKAVTVGVPGVLGMHLEGPFLSPERPGIHSVANIRPLEDRDIKNLGEFKGGKLLVTIAPEHQADGMLKKLVATKAIVFAGHSDATESQIRIAEVGGLVGATHLFNAMSQMTGRAPGVVGAILSSTSLAAGIIADGHHVSWSNLAVAARLLPDRLCLVTDAMSTLAGKNTQFCIHGKTVRLKDGKITDDNGRLAGAHIAMDECVRNTIRYANVTPARAVAMASKNPASVLGLHQELGSIKVGYRASLTIFNKDMETTNVIVDGEIIKAEMPV